jgi:GT2 family glycosyltransferase
MKYSLVIPNYNGEKLLEKNLPKVIEVAKEAEIIVVDDASTDDSLTTLKQFPVIKVIKHKKNLGFARACNHGVSKAKGKIVILLNTDVYPKDNFILPLLAHFNTKEVFAVGCQEIIGDKTRGKSIGKFEKGFLLHNEAPDRKSGPSLWAFGASAAFDRMKWIELGGMDALFRPAYWEDIDLSWRAWKKGWKVYFEPKSQVQHQPESTNLDAFGKKGIKLISSRNQYLFVWKNIHDRNLILNHLIWLPVNLIKAAATLDISFILGFFQAIIRLPEAIKARRVAKSQSLRNDSEIIKQFSEE